MTTAWPPPDIEAVPATSTICRPGPAPQPAARAGVVKRRRVTQWTHCGAVVFVDEAPCCHGPSPGGRERFNKVANTAACVRRFHAQLGQQPRHVVLHRLSAKAFVGDLLVGQASLSRPSSVRSWSVGLMAVCSRRHRAAWPSARPRCPAATRPIFDGAPAPFP